MRLPFGIKGNEMDTSSSLKGRANGKNIRTTSSRMESRTTTSHSKNARYRADLNTFETFQTPIVVFISRETILHKNRKKHRTPPTPHLQMTLGRLSTYAAGSQSTSAPFVRPETPAKLLPHWTCHSHVLSTGSAPRGER